MTDLSPPGDPPGEERLRETENGREPASQPDAPPPAVSPSDPVSPATHADGGTYGQGDYSPAARRSQLRTDQLERPPGPKDADAAQHSGFAEAEGREGPASVAGGH